MATSHDNSLTLTEPGWPKLDSGVPDAGTSFANTFMKGMAIGHQRRELEEEIARLNMRNLVDENRHVLEMGRTAKDAAFKIADDQRADDSLDWQRFIQWKQYERDKENDETKQNNKDLLDQDITDFQTEVAAIPHEKGSLEYEKELVQIQARHSKGANSKSGLLTYRSAAEDHNLAVRRAIDVNTFGWKELQHKAGNLFWNDKNNPDLSPLFDDKFFEPLTTKQPGEDYDPAHPEKTPLKKKRQATPGRGQGAIKESKNFLAIPQYDKTGKMLPPKRVAVSELTALRQQYQDLVEQRKNIPGQINNSIVQARASDSSFSGPTERQTWERGMRDPSLTPQEKAKLERVGKKKGWM